MDKKLYPRIGEEVIWVTLDNGLPFHQGHG